MDDQKWCHVCSGTGTDANGDECICRFTQAFEPKENRFYREAQPRDGYEPPIIDSGEPTMVDLKPTTVGGWMRTLPPFENAPAWVDCKRLTDSCFCLQQAISHVALHVSGITAKRYWSGACDRIYCYGTDAYKSKWKAYRAGYAAMDAYLEPEQSPENVVGKSPEKVYSDVLQMVAGEGISPETHGIRWVERDGRLVYEFYELHELPNGDKPFAVAYTSIHPDDLAELRRKAAAYDQIVEIIKLSQI